ncbi:MAG: hypothetical protein ACOYNL_10105 [Rickettsiales bacterium]
MVSTASAYDFSAVIEGFFAQKRISGAHSHLITSTIRERALNLLSHEDVRYVPAFKILDMLAALVTIGVAIADATQLRPVEVRALLRESLSDTTPLVRQFMLEAALERARYEPLMIAEQQSDAAKERDIILQRRWAAMRAAHQEKAQLPDDWMDAIDSAVERALVSPDFRHFRQGPLLQFFAEMLSTGRKLHQQRNTLITLIDALAESSSLWRRYALKSARFSEKPVKTVEIARIQPSHTIH